STFVLCVLHRRSDQRGLLSFPTRRSSDLAEAAAHVAGLLPANNLSGPSCFDFEAPAAPFKAGQAPAKAAAAVADAGSAVELYAGDRKSTRLNSSHVSISYAVFCLKKKKRQ